MTVAAPADPPASPAASRAESDSVRAEIGNIAGIEGLRGVAVLWVILFHYFSVRNPAVHDPWNAWIAGIRPLQLIVANGYLGVDLFFLITGFLLMLPWFRHRAEGRPPPGARSFYLRRILRIVPAYYVQLVFLFGFAAPVLLGFGVWKISGSEFMIYNLAAHLSFSHYFTPYTAASLSINGPLWSLALEAQYYLVLPLLALFFVRAPLASAISLIAIAVTWRLLAGIDLQPLVDAEMRIGARWDVPEKSIRELIANQLPGYLAHFSIGILAGYAWLKSRREWAGRMRPWMWTAIAVAALLFLFWLYAGGGMIVGPLSWLASVAGMGVAMLGLVSSPLASGPWLLGNPALQLTGRVSYSAYLYHMPILLLWNKLGPSLGWLTFPLFLTVVLGVSWMSYRFIERPFMSWGRPSASAPGNSRT